MMKQFVFASLLIWTCGASATSAISSQTITEKSNITIPCKNEGRVSWSKTSAGRRVIIIEAPSRESTIKNDSDPRFTLLADLSLSINNTLVSDSGIYYCNATAVVSLTVMPLKVFSEVLMAANPTVPPNAAKGRASEVERVLTFGGVGLAVLVCLWLQRLQVD